MKKENQKTHTASLHEWATAYLDYSKKQHVKKTFEEKRFAFKSLFQSVDANLPIDEITPMMALNHLQSQVNCRSGNGANKDRKNLQAAWKWGMKYKNLPHENPFNIVSRFAETRDERHVPSMEDFWATYRAAAPNKQDQCMLFFFLHTGARRDEGFRLKWKDVDFIGKRVRLIWRKNVLGEWKESWQPISDELVEMLQVQRKTTGLLGFVFMHHTDDAQWVPYQWRQHWLKKLCAKAGLQKFGFHGIRHLFASILAAKNVPLVEIQKMLRHASIATTQRYIHSLQEGSREALAALPKLVEVEARRKVM